MVANKLELAMFLTQVAWESDGLKAKEEYEALQGHCNDKYKANDDVAGHHYWGRGYIQLTWSYNYKAASQDLYQNDDLLQNPENVATDEQKAWDTAAWFWAKNVHSQLAASPQEFGLTTRAINGKLECDDPTGEPRAKKRFANFVIMAEAFHLDRQLYKESGCYPVSA